MTISVEPPPVEDLDAGVIDDALARQRRHRAAGAAIVLVAAAVVGIVVGFSGGGGRAAHASRPANADGQLLTLTFRSGLPYVNGEPLAVGIAPTFTAGVVGLDVMALQNGQSGGLYPTAADPVVGSFAEGRLTAANRPVNGLIYATVVASSVATMRVAHLGIFKPHRALGLPAGYRVFVFSRPPGSRGTVIAPDSPQGPLPPKQQPALTETFYDSSGRLLPSTPQGGAFRVGNSYWQAPATPPTNAPCTLGSSLPGVATQWGQVATAIAADAQATGAQFLSCLDTFYSWRGSSFEVALLLNARSPKSTAAPLWNARPLAGHPAIAIVPPVEVRNQLNPFSPLPSLAQLTKRFGRAEAERQLANDRRLIQRYSRSHPWRVYAPGIVARRVGPAWLVVRDGGSLTQRIQFLNGLHLTRLDLSHM